jgi:predicted dehydrogenase
MKFGLVGAGCIGQLRAKALEGVPGCELSGVADADQGVARELASSHKAEVFGNFQDLFAKNDADAVIIATPPQFHEEMVIAALEQGKHVLCEKPLANTLSACRKMVEVSRTTGKVLTTGFNHRYFPAIQYVKQKLASGAIGELDHIRAFAGHSGLSEFRNPWEYDKDVIGGGALMDVGIHMIDLTRYLLGDVEEVFGVATNNVWKLGHSEDNGIAMLRSPQGKTAVLQATWSEWKGYRFHIEAYGEKGMLRAYYAPMMSMGIFMDEPGGPRRRKFQFYPGMILREKLKGWQSSVVQMFQEEFADFVKLTAGQQGAIADGFAGFRAVEIANAVYQSTLEKQSIRLAAPF